MLTGQQKDYLKGQEKQRQKRKKDAETRHLDFWTNETDREFSHYYRNTVAGHNRREGAPGAGVGEMATPAELSADGFAQVAPGRWKKTY
jgi:hypothetical protein